MLECDREDYEDCKTRDARKVGCLCLKSALAPAGKGLVQQKHASHSRAPASEISRACMYQSFKGAHAVTLAVNHVASIHGLEGQARIAEPHRTTEDIISPHGRCGLTPRTSTTKETIPTLVICMFTMYSLPGKSFTAARVFVVQNLFKDEVGKDPSEQKLASPPVTLLPRVPT
jgi:hypothetical protein